MGAAGLSMLTDGRKSAAFLLYTLVMYGMVMLIKYGLVVLVVAMVFAGSASPCLMSPFFLALLAVSGLQLLCGSCFVISLGFDDAVEEAFFNYRSKYEKQKEAVGEKEPFLT